MKNRSFKDAARALLPWLISGSLLAYVLYTHDLVKVARSFEQARIAPFMAWVICFVIFWLFFHSLFLFLCLRWFVSARSPYWDDTIRSPEPRFNYSGIVQASAAVYLLHILNIVIAYGGLVAYLYRRFGIPPKRGLAAGLNSLLNSFASLGILAYISVKLLPPDLIPIHARDQIELAATVGLAGIGFYLLCFTSSMTGRITPGFRNQDHLFTPFIWSPVYAYPVLLLIQLIQIGTHGLFVILTMPAFGLHPPAMATMALTQVVFLARGLPISAFGIGLDQLTIPYLFQGWDNDGAVLAFSIAFTFSQIAVRFLIGLPFFTKATREMFDGGRKSDGAG